MTSLKLPKAVLDALSKLGVLEDELLAVVNSVEQKDGSLEAGGEAVKTFITEKITPHLGIQAAEALAGSVLAQILGGKPGFDPDHAMDA